MCRTLCRALVALFPIIALIGVLMLIVSCVPTDDPDAARPAGSDGWLTGDTHQKFETIAGQLRGFDMAMVEVGYRFQELYWAGEDENWEFAKYHIEKIRTAMEDGFERRPAREASAEAFMNNALPAIEQAVVRGDADLFRERFQNLTANCNACHVMEDVRFIVVEEPTVRANAWRGPQ